MEDYSLVQVVSLFLPDAHLQEERTKKRQPFESCLLYKSFEDRLFLFVTLVEFINATCSVNQFHLTSIEWVRCV